MYMDPALTDSTGNVVNSYLYDSFGNIVDETEGVENFYTYTSREFDNESGLYYYRARYYDAGIGRFLSEDSVNCLVKINVYIYANNNPVILTDPDGLKPGDKFESVDAAAIDALNYIYSTYLVAGKKCVEHCNWIKETETGKKCYTYDEPDTQNRVSECNLTSWQYGYRGWFHNHCYGEDFSKWPNDKAISDFNGVPGYLLTPSGKIKKYRFGKVSIIRN